jgi:hypothetical protein
MVLNRRARDMARILRKLEGEEIVDSGSEDGMDEDVLESVSGESQGSHDSGGDALTDVNVYYD